MTVLGRGLVFQPVLVTQTCTYNSKYITLTLQIFHQKREKNLFQKEHNNPPPKKKKNNNNNKKPTTTTTKEATNRQTDRQTDRQRQRHREGKEKNTPTDKRPRTTAIHRWPCSD